MSRVKRYLTIAALTVLLGRSVQAVEPGRADGTFALDATSATLAYATCCEVEGLYDSARKDTLVVLTDVALGDIPASDDWALAQAAKRGERVVLTVRLNGAKLVNVRVNHKALDGTIVLPGQWFTYRASKPPAHGVAGSLTLSKRDSDGHAYACRVDFAATPAAPAPEAKPQAAPKAPAPAPADPPAAPAATSTIDPKALTAPLIAAMMQKDENQAVKLVKLGADPNGRDQYGVPVLNWAVMMCMPSVVKALVDAKADLTYQRAPGLTILKEAGACPEAEKILRAAGAK